MPKPIKPALKPSLRGSTATYKQIEDNIRHKIHQGYWTVGTMLPGRRDLAREYGVSVITIERAITRLIADGLLRADDRRGTFVTDLETVDLALSLAKTDHFAREAGAGIAHRASTALGEDLATGRIGIIAALYWFSHDHLGLHNFWMRLTIQALEHEFSQRGMATHFFNRVQAPGQPLISLSDAIGELLADGVDGIAIIGWGIEPSAIDEALDLRDLIDTPAVCITTGELRRQVPHVFPDNSSAGYQAAQHLLRAGCREIVFVSPFAASWVTERLSGAQAAAQHAKLGAEAVRAYPSDVHPWIQEEDPEVLGYEAARPLFAERRPLTGVMCANDGVALGFLRAASEFGRIAGQDFYLIGFDDHPDARTQRLSTLRPPMDAMGQEASRLMVRALQGDKKSLQVRLGWNLIPRASTCGQRRFSVRLRT
ncbi:MAG TPA: substrate-binding domain-containing protein [Capsulimonadaceae bacterium]|nr:substrate-binding domain-containing protein [Capsulimonadaceae bacterium]